MLVVPRTGDDPPVRQSHVHFENGFVDEPVPERRRLDADARHRAADGDGLELRDHPGHDAVRQRRVHERRRRGSCPRHRPTPRRCPPPARGPDRRRVALAPLLRGHGTGSTTACRASVPCRPVHKPAPGHPRMPGHDDCGRRPRGNRRRRSSGRPRRRRLLLATGGLLVEVFERHRVGLGIDVALAEQYLEEIGLRGT